MKIKVSITAMILMGVSTGAWAAGDDDAEATIRLMGTAEAELPDAVTKQISLPKDLIDAEDQVAAVERAKKGHDKANERHESRCGPRARCGNVREDKGNARESRPCGGRTPRPAESPG